MTIFQKTSPSPRSSESTFEMNFPDAMREVLNGKSITRRDWKEACVCKLKDTYLCIFIRGEWHPWIVNDGDMSGVDWIITADKEINSPVRHDIYE